MESFNLKFSLDDLKNLTDVGEEITKALYNHYIGHYKYFYKVCFFETSRHRKPNNILYFNNEEDVKWIFETEEYDKGLARVEYIKVCRLSPEYELAINDTKTIDETPDKIEVCLNES